MENDLKMKTQDELNRDRIRLLQYDNLRKYFSLVIDIMIGEDYYTGGMDVYSSDICAFEDLIHKYGTRKQIKKWEKEKEQL